MSARPRLWPVCVRCGFRVVRPRPAPPVPVLCPACLRFWFEAASRGPDAARLAASVAAFVARK